MCVFEVMEIPVLCGSVVIVMELLPETALALSLIVTLRQM